MLELPIDPNDPVIVLECEIEGKLLYHARLALDTGATFVVLSWRIIRGIQVAIDINTLVSTTTATSVESAPLVYIPKISVRDKSFRNVPCLVKDLPAESGVDGLLGLSFLRHFSLTIDFPRGTLAFR